MTTQTSDAVLARMMDLHPKVIDLTLDRVWALLDKLGNPQTALPPVIHVAGTNGKGSTQAMIRAGLQGAGKSVHAYTSPHLARFHERIRLAGRLITEEALTALLDECYTTNGPDPITYFEITTVAALLGFARTPADYTLLEVGLGGRLDATNVIDAPAACVITPVDLDHQQFLGDTLGAIAGEKAGILKRGVTAIVGPQKDEALEVIERTAARVGAPLLIHGQHWHVGTEHGRLIYQDETGLLDLPLPSLLGPHQVENAGAALAVLRHLHAGEASYGAATQNASWPARMQRLSPINGCDVWLDGGHNPAAGHAIARTLGGLAPKPTHLITGMINTKDVAGFLGPFAAQATSMTALSIPDEPNAVPAADIAAAAASVGLPSHVADDFEGALQTLTQKNPDSRILICGSLYLAGHVMRVLDIHVD